VGHGLVDVHITRRLVVEVVGLAHAVAVLSGQVVRIWRSVDAVARCRVEVRVSWVSFMGSYVDVMFLGSRSTICRGRSTV
jgi:hypothetical protein